MSTAALAALTNHVAASGNQPPTDIVRHAATRLVRRLPSVVRYDDLYSAGLTALVEAAHRFDTSRGVDFRTYAKHRVYGAMLDELRRLDTVSRDRRRAIREGNLPEGAMPAPRLVELNAAVAVADPTPNVEDELDRRRALQRMRDAVETLPPRLRLVLRLRITEGWTLREVADHLGVTEARACQLVGEVVRRLREAMKDPSEADDARNPLPEEKPAPRRRAAGAR